MWRKHFGSMRIFQVLFCFALFVVSVNGTAATVDRLMQASGITKQLESFPDMLKAGINQEQLQQGGENNPISSVITRAVDQSIQPIIIKNNIRNLLEKNMTEAELAGLMRWYDSDLGKEVTRAEEQASTPEGYRQLARMAEQLMQDKKRLDLVAEIDEVIQATEFSYELQMGTQIGIIAAMQNMMNPESSVDMEMLRMQMQSQELQMKQVLHENVLLSLSYTYRDFSDAEVKQYIDFLKTPEARKFNTLATRELKESLLRGMSVLGENIARGLRARQMLHQ